MPTNNMLPVGSRVRIVRVGRRVSSGFVPYLGRVGVIEHVSPEDRAGYVYTVRLPGPKGVELRLVYQADEVEGVIDEKAVDDHRTESTDQDAKKRR